ncbi:MAG: hydrogen peroxide-inducible genes activator [Myxococcales bacterium]|nr:MAG: hydrogen peroxide-inducible genes activator [Myxococcales bacterium]
MPSISQLEYMVAVYRTGHFGNAAELCRVAQPTLSAQIQRAEEELGFAVFDRSRKPVTPTTRGYAILEQAQVVVGAHERLMSQARHHAEKFSGDFSLALIPTLAPYVLPWFLKNFAQHYPEVLLHLSEKTTEQIVSALQKGLLDAAILATPLGESVLVEDALFYDPFYLYAHKADPLLKKREVSVKDLRNNKIWLLEDGHCFRNQLLNYCHIKEGCAQFANVNFSAGSFETLRNLIDAAGGYTLFPESYAQTLPRTVQREQIRAFRDPVPTREVSLVYPKRSWKLDLVHVLRKTVLAGIPRVLSQSPRAKAHSEDQLG